MTLRQYLYASLLVLSLLPGMARAADPVVVSSKLDTEGSVLGNLIQLALEGAGIPTTSRISLGDTREVRQALLKGDIDIYPEYTGNGAFFFDMVDNPVWKNRQQAYELVRDRDLQENGVVWLQPADADNNWAICIRRDLSREHGLYSLEDLARYLNGGGYFKLAASKEFVEHKGALPAFQWAYGFDLGPDQLELLPDGNTAATMRAAAEGTDGINGAMAYATDGGLQALDLHILTDPQGVQPVYQPAPTLRRELLAAYPQIPAVLNPIFAKLDLQTLQHLNEEVAFEEQDPREVAARFLTTLSSP